MGEWPGSGGLRGGEGGGGEAEGGGDEGSGGEGGAAVTDTFRNVEFSPHVR
jgi:hypothetical protein